MTLHTPSLCFPDEEKSCFACCPPIRCAGYEHLQYKPSIMRMLRENSERSPGDGRGEGAITGFSCWALGYVDKGFRLVGCLLHPLQNGGLDLRYRVDYGGKCERESCQEQKIFSELEVHERRHWLGLADGLDSFSYSSRSFNPLFQVLNWGASLLHMISEEDGPERLTIPSFLTRYPLFSTGLVPRANAYPLYQLISKTGVGPLRNHTFRYEFEGLVGTLAERLKHSVALETDAPAISRLALDWGFLDFLRLSVGVRKMTKEKALLLKKTTDEEIERLGERWKKRS